MLLSTWDTSDSIYKTYTYDVAGNPVPYTTALTSAQCLYKVYEIKAQGSWGASAPVTDAEKTYLLGTLSDTYSVRFSFSSITQQIGSAAATTVTNVGEELFCSSSSDEQAIGSNGRVLTKTVSDIGWTSATSLGFLFVRLEGDVGEVGSKYVHQGTYTLNIQTENKIGTY